MKHNKTSISQNNTESSAVPVMLDLFSGAGGTGAGFKKAGFKIVGAVEINTDAALTYRNNLDVEVEEIDITELDPKKYRNKIGLKQGELDVLVGCPPCQGFSRMRNGNGAADERNSLVLSYLSFVNEFLPKYAVFENVPGMLRYSYAKDFYNQLIEGLEELGYKVEKLQEDAADYGTPQHRKRVVVIACAEGYGIPKPIKTHGNPHSEEVKNHKIKPWVTVKDAIKDYPELEAGENGDQGDRYKNHISAKIFSDRVKEFIGMVPKDGGSRKDVPKEYWLQCHLDNENGFSDVYGRLDWNKPSGTLTCGCTSPSKGRFIHPEQNRGISCREAAALQGFSDSFIFYGKDIARQIGNAVTPQLSEALAKAITKQIKLNIPKKKNKHSA